MVDVFKVTKKQKEKKHAIYLVKASTPDFAAAEGTTNPEPVWA